jgi:hypothetical protein
MGREVAKRTRRRCSWPADPRASLVLAGEPGQHIVVRLVGTLWRGPRRSRRAAPRWLRCPRRRCLGRVARRRHGPKVSTLSDSHACRSGGTPSKHRSYAGSAADRAALQLGQQGHSCGHDSLPIFGHDRRRRRSGSQRDPDVEAQIGAGHADHLGNEAHRRCGRSPRGRALGAVGACRPGGCSTVRRRERPPTP